MTPTHRQGDTFLDGVPVRVSGLRRACRIMGGVENPECPLVVAGRGEEATVEALSWDEVLDDGRLTVSCISCSPAGSTLLSVC